MPHTLAQWLNYIESQHSMAIDMGLERCQRVWEVLRDTQNSPCVITVAGTNGKGTTCACIEAVLVEAGYRVGTYSSPHLQIFNERIRLNGELCDDALICDAFAKVDIARDNISLTYFEFATLAALTIYQAQQVDVIILEVGLGGRLDATNIIAADIAVITSIGLDHQEYLGDTLPLIAAEKAGIIKPASHLVVGVDTTEFEYAWENTVAQRVTMVDTHCHIDPTQRSIVVSHALDDSKDVEVSVNNPHVPLRNVATAILALIQLSRFNSAPSKRLSALLTASHALQTCIDQVKLPGRYQVLHARPKVIADVAHNAQAAQYLASRLAQESFARIHFVVGMLKDKNIEQSIEQLLKFDAYWYTCDLPPPRGEQAARLTTFLSASTQSILQFTSVQDALTVALKRAKDVDIVCIMGSFLTVAHATEFFNQHKE